MDQQNNRLTTSISGYPRIGYNREWKKALERYWSQKSSVEELTAELHHIEQQRIEKMASLELTHIPVNDYTWYDHVLDTAIMFNIIPSRFLTPSVQKKLNSQSGNGSNQQAIADALVELTFAMARGTVQSAACEMTKWFNTNYHYIVPEWEHQTPKLLYNYPLAAIERAVSATQIEIANVKPVVVGPYTFVRLMKGIQASDRASVLGAFADVYVQMVTELKERGVHVLQLDEPAFLHELSQEELNQTRAIYEKLRHAAGPMKLWVQTYFEGVANYKDIVSLPVEMVGLDFVHGRSRNLQALEKHGFPADKTLAVGIIDGRNIWRTDLARAHHWLQQHVEPYVSRDSWIIQASCSLLHVPLTLSNEDTLPAYIQPVLAGADEKLEEIQTLAAHLKAETEGTKAALDNSARIMTTWLNAPERKRPEMLAQLAEARKDAAASTRIPFSQRQIEQKKRWPELPILPTTSIGSLPQSADVRRERLKFRREEITAAQYEQYIEREIKRWVDIQLELDLDVLVHGEFERTDMVEYFGEKLEGFVFTKNGWVQSYGSRCVKPPILFGDVAFTEPMTVKESEYAQTLTKKPLKGMLTGPVTILNWSFVRDDIPRKDSAFQLSWALRQEIQALEAAGIGMIQVDEPAVKEGMPLHPEDQDAYRQWTVQAFKLATSGVRPDTQIHTHMCYCDFSDMLELIKEMDADVISIETARSGGDIVEVFAKHTYELGIGLGVYDIHSPRIPEVKEMVDFIHKALEVLPLETFWINPDCGLKTRNEHETIEALRHMVQTAKQIREEKSASTVSSTL
ncbi:5-methyltetrahydropteroyltriglutamate--homocysteine S-methyltransferase [Paenibacillus sp. 1001270B_150601_E10]|uniref:5-methyltetrahydropteroyltriglutamate-- homocysteine S-methyltransferase n=1 Tax=Paenibacillus sp. 1001270B_150601_E10 TaxID=2787079 RepID=UPI00189FF0A2|nr:5-methyltetrahydropteroyltriglutamate--homocysteine S-methyltransferase [Paenibacillus sp. 1001270B_150601_E10]